MYSLVFNRLLLIKCSTIVLQKALELSVILSCCVNQPFVTVSLLVICITIRFSGGLLISLTAVSLYVAPTLDTRYRVTAYLCRVIVFNLLCFSPYPSRYVVARITPRLDEYETVVPKRLIVCSNVILFRTLYRSMALLPSYSYLMLCFIVL